jgi:hypothetical protein
MMPGTAQAAQAVRAQATLKKEKGGAIAGDGARYLERRTLRKLIARTMRDAEKEEAWGRRCTRWRTMPGMAHDTLERRTHDDATLMTHDDAGESRRGAKATHEHWGSVFGAHLSLKRRAKGASATR